MSKFSVGDKVSYRPVILDDDKNCVGKVEMTCDAGNIFKMDMISIDTVPHWIPAHECELVESKKED